MRVFSVLVFDIEGVGCGSQSNHGFSRLQIVVDLFHLIVWQIPETGSDDHQISGAQRLQTRKVISKIGIDHSRLARMLRIEHGAVETMAL